MKNESILPLLKIFNFSSPLPPYIYKYIYVCVYIYLYEYIGRFRDEMNILILKRMITAMKQRRSGRIAFVSSAAGQLGIYGYSAYAPAKFALRGFAEALQMELEPYNIAITVLYPPNTDTEGFQVNGDFPTI